MSKYFKIAVLVATIAVVSNSSDAASADALAFVPCEDRYSALWQRFKELEQKQEQAKELLRQQLNEIRKLRAENTELRRQIDKTGSGGHKGGGANE
jgi:Skp family chaperone for outer membrane proteins